MDCAGAPSRKFSADLAYSEGDYPKALGFYEDVISGCSKNNMTLLRDAVEGAARCSIKMEAGEKALKMAQKLVCQAEPYFTGVFV